VTTLEIARRLDARPAGTSKWQAKCPAHDDRQPSLSVREGRGGRTLIQCFAGCEPAAIVAACGLRLSDLFMDDRPSDDYRRQTSRRISADGVEVELQLERDRIVASDSERCGFDVAETGRHRNEARAIVERRFSVRLKHELAPWYEVEPHCADPAWSGCVDAALVVVGARANLSGDELRAKIHALPATQERILRLARCFQRELARPFVQAEAA
jgi:hypothetical protein